MADILPPSPVDAPFGSVNWQDWFLKVRTTINNAADITWSQITDFTGSNLTNLVVRLHSSLQNVQGSVDQYHISSAQYTALGSGFTGTIITAKLTTGGTNGSMTFSHGVLTASTPAT